MTIRKSLELLEQEQMIVREVGRGTRVHLGNYGNANDMEMIVLIAPSKNPFFSQFIARFQQYAEQKNQLVLYVEKPKTEEIEHCLYRLYKRGLRNVVVWLEDLEVNKEKLMRLRAIGMNLVFFDSNKGLPFADCVAVDNQRAISELYLAMQKKGAKNIVYIGWDIPEVYSIQEREKTFRQLPAELDQKIDAENIPHIFHVEWSNRKRAKEILSEKFAQWNAAGNMPDGILCGDRETGIMMRDIRRDNQWKLVLGSIDDVPSEEGEMITYTQNLQDTIERILECLEQQAALQEKWKAELYLVLGSISA